MSKCLGSSLGLSSLSLARLGLLGILLSKAIVVVVIVVALLGVNIHVFIGTALNNGGCVIAYALLRVLTPVGIGATLGLVALQGVVIPFFIIATIGGVALLGVGIPVGIVATIGCGVNDIHVVVIVLALHGDVIPVVPGAALLLLVGFRIYATTILIPFLVPVAYRSATTEPVGVFISWSA